MRTAIFTIDTESYEAKKKSAAGEALKRMLEQNRLEVKALRKCCQEIKKLWRQFFASWQTRALSN